MEASEAITRLFVMAAEAALSVIVPFLTYQLFRWVKTKAAAAENEYLENFVRYLEELVRHAVDSTNQTFVNTIKAAREDGKLTEDEALEAFEQTQEAVLASLSVAGAELAHKLLGDLDQWLAVLIEAAVARTFTRYEKPEPAPASGS